MYAFVAGAATMALLCLLLVGGIGWILAKVTGTAARVISESVQEVLSPKQEPEQVLQPEVPTHTAEDEVPRIGPQGAWLEGEEIPPWELEDMEPLP